MWAGYRMAPAAKYYHQAYRHGLLEHCLGVAQAVSAISATFGGSTATSRSRGRCCTTSASSRPTATSSAEQHRAHRRSAGCTARSRSATTGSAARSRTSTASRELAQAIGHIILSHHGVARARQPGGAVHARGDARAHDRQPRRAPGQLRPAREGARRRAPLVELRPRDRRRRVLRRPRRRLRTAASRRSGRASAPGRLRAAPEPPKPPETPQIAARCGRLAGHTARRRLLSFQGRWQRTPRS